MLTRREFIKLVINTTAAVGLSQLLIPHLAEAFAGRKKVPVIWLECMTCTGNILSYLNTYNPEFRKVLFEILDLRFSNTIMAAEGGLAIKALLETAEKEKGEYLLLVEGTIPTRDKGMYGLIGHYPDGKPFTMLEAVKKLASAAKYIIAVGTCATFGGPFAARPNPSISKSVSQVIKEPVINVPGCPINPDWLMGTLTHLLLYGVPELDAFARPILFYGKRIHDFCPRRQHFENSIFAKYPGDEGCLYKIGCKGPVTYSDCPTRQWSSAHNNWPVEANTPCIGCVSPEFPDDMMPFFEHLPDVILPGIRPSANKVGLAVGTVTALGIGAHLVGNIITGRLGKYWVDGTKAREHPVPEDEDRPQKKVYHRYKEGE